MALGRKISNNKYVRDIEADYIEALSQEYHNYMRVGNLKAAESVAGQLETLGHPVKKVAPKKEKAVAEDTTEKAVSE